MSSPAEVERVARLSELKAMLPGSTGYWYPNVKWLVAEVERLSRELEVMSLRVAAHHEVMPESDLYPCVVCEGDECEQGEDA